MVFVDWEEGWDLSPKAHFTKLWPEQGTERKWR